MGELGSLLTRAREARGLTLEDAERDTRISRRYLQALEGEQFEVIPAPVYARGFLRSYSQYLGLDPSEALSMFPREDDPEYQRVAEATTPPPRASREAPVSPQSPARPTWRAAPQPPRETQPARAPGRPQPANKQAPLGRPNPALGKRPSKQAQQDPGWEPVIGVDIGVPSPADRIKTDPAAQTRSMVVAIVAVGVIVGTVLLALLISNLGGSNAPPGTGVDATKNATSGVPTSTVEGGSSGVQITAGIVPTLVGLPEATAKKALAEAGYQVRELRVKVNGFEKGTIAEQSPAAGQEWAAGQTVQIVISDGQ
ncbi:MAG: helix-turn-helix domain-containing protein [bacterium]